MKTIFLNSKTCQVFKNLAGLHTLLIIAVFFRTSQTVLSQNVGINPTGAAPDASAMLDIVSSDKGLLIPRVSLSSNLLITPFSSTPANSLLVYNTNASMTNGGVGYWFWNTAGSQWVSLLSSVGTGQTPWLITGNSGTSASTDFIGTTDNVALNFRVNNQKAGTLDPAGPVFLGYKAGNASPASTNTGIGYEALSLNTGVGEYNTATGYQALKSNLNGDYNTANGYQALYLNVGSNNTALGASALRTCLTGTSNTAIGYSSLYSTTVGPNTAIGSQAMYSNTTGQFNDAVGYQAMYSNLKGIQNSAIGANALYNNTNAGDNVAVGYQSLYTQSYANGTTAWSSKNIAFGYQALYSNQPTATTNGIQNTAVGAFSLYSNTTGINNTALGYNAFNAGTAYNNSMALGANAVAIDASNLVHIGDASITSIKAQVSPTTYSDARIKNSVQENVPGLAFIKELRPVTYRYDIDKENEITGTIDTVMWEGKYDIEKIQFSGFIAQEVDAAAKKTGYDFSGVDKVGKLWGLRYAEFTVPLVKAVQELSQENDNLELMLKGLESENKNLNNQISELKQKFDARIKTLEKAQNSFGNKR